MAHKMDANGDGTIAASEYVDYIEFLAEPGAEHKVVTIDQVDNLVRRLQKKLLLWVN